MNSLFPLVNLWVSSFHIVYLFLRFLNLRLLCDTLCVSILFFTPFLLQDCLDLSNMTFFFYLMLHLLKELNYKQLKIFKF